MPSKKRLKKTSYRCKTYDHQLFWPLLVLVFILWVLYRSLFSFSIIFDELIGKAIFFAFPVLIYISINAWPAIMETFSLKKLKRGLLVGLAIGGLFGFTAAILSVLSRGGQVQTLAFYRAEFFWWELFLALLTGFFETFFFFSFVMLVIEDRYRQWPLLKKISLIAAIFLIFHLPNLFLNFSGVNILLQALLLFVLAYGEALFFIKRHNAYSLVMIQAIWGMVLLLHF